MKILISSHLFHPSVGGIESVSLMLADQFCALGHEVRVVTETHEHGDRTLPFEVLRRPSCLDLCQAVSWCDLYFHNNISLRSAWPLLLVRRPWVVAHHTWMARPDGALGWQDRLKRFLLRFASSISISQAIADSLPVPSVILPDPYQDEVFRVVPGTRREKELIFVGRLVPDKGADVLIEALGRLKQGGLGPELTLVGDGPELMNLQTLAVRAGVRDQITFLGRKTGVELAALLNRHQILVVPSRWQEPFGIVALEGIACGCAVVGSHGGGLKDAIGPCGVTFPNGDGSALAAILSDLLSAPEKLVRYREHAGPHLQPHQRRTVARAYLRTMEAAMSAERQEAGQPVGGAVASDAAKR